MRQPELAAHLGISLQLDARLPICRLRICCGGALGARSEGVCVEGGLKDELGCGRTQQCCREEPALLEHLPRFIVHEDECWGEALLAEALRHTREPAVRGGGGMESGSAHKIAALLEGAAKRAIVRIAEGMGRLSLQRVSLQRVGLQRVSLQQVSLQRVGLQRVGLQRVGLLYTRVCQSSIGSSILVKRICADVEAFLGT
tara:strand:- start:109 stop:708 length:600 start_codon:yes stop_codon:yes gene_type:complete